ncbi:MAG: response regulator [Spirochaetes bacterium]|nr:response regulator [Spirochaetota bacterium]
MENKILIVDDDENILSSLKRQFHNKYSIVTAVSGKQGLEEFEKQKPFAVVISDYRMPEMNGAEFLAKVREKYPNTVRFMLTGQADMEGIIDVINQGQVFRFLTKPCPPDLMIKNIEDGIAQYRLITAEKILIEKTLSGSIKVLTDILALVSPQAFSRASRVRRIVQEFIDKMNIKNPWQLEIAAMLSQIGCVTLPDFLISKVYNNKDLLPNEYTMFQNHPKIGSEMIANIPRLKQVAKIIEYQEKLYNGRGVPRDDLAGQDIPLGARILKLALDFDTLIQSGLKRDSIMDAIRQRVTLGWYDEQLVEILERPVVKRKKYVSGEVSLSKLNETMILADDLLNTKGTLLLGSKGQEVTKSFIYRLINIEKNEGIRQPVKVVYPLDE